MLKWVNTDDLPLEGQIKTNVNSYHTPGYKKVTETMEGEKIGLITPLK